MYFREEKGIKKVTSGICKTAGNPFIFILKYGCAYAIMESSESKEAVRCQMGANREFKNSVFTALFDDAGELISLYNALSGGGFPSDTPVMMATLEDVLYNDRYNDIAFVLDDKIVVLVEHQSTVSENMPLRLLIYIARVYEKLIDSDAVYRSRLMKIPKPDFIVLYNGTDPFPDERTLRLSDAYTAMGGSPPGLGGSLDLEVRVVNINEGRNGAIVGKCETLHGYVLFVGKVRANRKAGMDLSRAVTKAAKDCINERILADFLRTHSSEVINMLTTEWNAERAQMIAREEALEEGIEIGEARGEAQVTQVIKLFVQKKSPKEISATLGVTQKKVKDILRASGLTGQAQ